MQRLTSDKELDRLFSEFLRAAVSAVAKNSEQVREISRSGNFRLNKGVFFDTVKCAAEEQRLISWIVKALGPNNVEEIDASYLAWNYVDRIVDAEGRYQSEEIFNDFALEAEKWRSEPVRYLLPNSVVQLKGDGLIEIGNVKLRRATDVIEELSETLNSAGARIEVGKPGNVEWSETPTFYMSESCWDVTLAASPSTKAESALWLVDVAISLIRLTLYKEPGQGITAIGQVEAKSGEAPLYISGGLSIGSSAVGGGAKSTLGVYQVDLNRCVPEARELLRSRGRQIFNAKNGSVAERLQQGLGWLTRSRTTRDRPERLLYQFTAVEALLSNSDRSAPITQTISRHAAVIMTNDPDARLEIAKKFTDLYSVRSKLVHSGKRDVSSRTSDLSQVLIENLYIKVMLVFDIDAKHQDFCQQLANASFGGAWPPKTAT